MSDLIPDGWSIKNVNEFTLEHKQGYYTKNAYNPHGTYLIRITDLNNPTINYSDMPRLPIDEKEFSQFKVDIGDFLFARSGAIGRYGIVTKDYPSIFASYLIRFKFDESLVITRYFGYAYESDICQSQLAAITQGSSNININADNIKSLSVPFPPLPEQQKIAAILTSVDDVIEKTQAQINKLKNLKTGMMQDLLTRGVGIDGKPHTEFKDSPVGRIPKAWDVSNVRDLITIMESGWSPQCSSQSAYDGQWCILKTTSVTWDGFNHKANKVLPESLNPRLNIQVNIDDILVTRAGPIERVGVVAYVDNVPEKVMLSDKIIRIKTNHSVLSKYLSLWLSGEFAQKYLFSRISGLASSQVNISQAILSSIPCAIPRIKEQEKIIKALEVIKNRVEVSEKRLLAKQKLKKALMQDLLTGKVRVEVE